MKTLRTKKTSNGSNFGWLIRQMSINQKSGQQTFRRRFASGSLFVSPCPPECYLQSETKIEPDLKLDKALLFFSVKERIQTLKFPFKPLRCCFRNDKLVNCHVRKFCKDLTFAHVPYHRRVKIFHAWFDRSNLSVSFLILLRSLWYVYLNNCSLQSRWIVALGIFTGSVNLSATIVLDFKEL